MHGDHKSVPKLWLDVNDSDNVCEFVVVDTDIFGSLLFGNKNNAFFRHKDPNSNVGCGIA